MALNDKQKYALVIFANWLLVLYACLTYRFCFYANITYIPLQIGLLVLNYRSAKKILPFVLLCVNFIAATGLANFLSARLYYIRVRADFESDLVGLFSVAVGLLSALFVSLILIIIKAVGLKRNKSLTATH